ncbi:MAG: cobalt ABC transporter substrate-binding protein CbiN [Candidatus Melainabacteria bacterium GWF2_37_15]|nr:MAG: cobalt ABC transporter substrate-binding protein CbiN [Candidatus Melainabacteria bacterium GWF2_37_15]
MQKLQNILLVALVVIIGAIPLFIVKNSDFAGADSQAEEVIMEMNQDYKPWFKPIWEPPGGEVETLLFTLQACIGAGFIGYFIGFSVGRQKNGD